MSAVKRHRAHFVPLLAVVAVAGFTLGACGGSGDGSVLATLTGVTSTRPAHHGHATRSGRDLTSHDRRDHDCRDHDHGDRDDRARADNPAGDGTGAGRDHLRAGDDAGRDGAARRTDSRQRRARRGAGSSSASCWLQRSSPEWCSGDVERLDLPNGQGTWRISHSAASCCWTTSSPRDPSSPAMSRLSPPRRRRSRHEHQMISRGAQPAGCGRSSRSSQPRSRPTALCDSDRRRQARSSSHTRQL